MDRDPQKYGEGVDFSVTSVSAPSAANMSFSFTGSRTTDSVGITP